MKMRIMLLIMLLAVLITADAAAAPVYKPPFRGAPDGGIGGAARVMKEVPFYSPSMRRAPDGRIGGATRGDKDFQLLVPNHTARTISDQPNLYWYPAKPASMRFKLTIAKGDEEQPFFYKELQGVKAGINIVRLAEYGVRLERDFKYEWCIIGDIDEHCGTILVVAPPAQLQDKLKTAGAGKAHYVYAEEGLWYDALQSISEMIEASPDKKDLRADRAALFEQVGLTDAADADKK